MFETATEESAQRARSASGSPYFRRTWSVTAVVCASAPAVPEIERVYVPVFVVEVVRTVSVDVVAVGFGENVDAAPAGRPVTASVTVPVKPAEGLTVTVYEAAPPRTIDWLAGVAPSEKLGGGSGGGAVTTSVALVECVVPVAVPVIVSG